MALLGFATGPVRIGHGIRAFEPAERRTGALDLVRQESHAHPAGRLEELVERALVDEMALVDDPHDVGQLLDLGQDVARDEDRPARIGQVAQLRPQAVDPGRVEAVGRLVEDEQLRVVQEGRGDAEPLAHPQRVVVDVDRRPIGEAHEREHSSTRPLAGSGPVEAITVRLSRPERYG